MEFSTEEIRNAVRDAILSTQDERGMVSVSVAYLESLLTNQQIQHHLKKRQTRTFQAGRKGYTYTVEARHVNPHHLRPVVRRVYQLLKREPGLTVAEMADREEMPLGSVYGAIRELLKARTIRRHEPTPV